MFFPFLLYSPKWKSSVEETKAQSHDRCHQRNQRKQQPWICWKSHRMCLQLYPTSASSPHNSGRWEAIPHFPCIQNQELSWLIKEKFIQMLAVIAPSFLTPSPSCEANLTSLLIRLGSAVTINLGAHEHGVGDTMLGALLPALMPVTSASHLWPSSCHINATNCSWQGNWAENHPKQNRNQQLRPIG